LQSEDDVVQAQTISQTNMAMMIIGENGNGIVPCGEDFVRVPNPLSIQQSAPLPLATCHTSCAMGRIRIMR